MKVVKSHIGQVYEPKKKWATSFLDDFFNDTWLISPFSRLRGTDFGWTPSCDVQEDEKALYIHAELPGVTADDIKVELHDGCVTISGEKKYEKEEKKKNTYRMERQYGAFTRTIPIGSEIDENKIKASFQDGVLNITLPKTHQSKGKVIPIQK